MVNAKLKLFNYSFYKYYISTFQETKLQHFKRQSFQDNNLFHEDYIVSIEGKQYNLAIYYNGGIINDACGIAYEGPDPKWIRVNRNMLFIDLCNRLIDATGIDHNGGNVLIIYRFPFRSYPYAVYYTSLAITDDDGVEGIFDLIDSTPSYNIADEHTPMDVYSPINTHDHHFEPNYFASSGHDFHGDHFEPTYIVPTGVNSDEVEDIQPRSTNEMCATTTYVVQEMIANDIHVPADDGLDPKNDDANEGVGLSTEGEQTGFGAFHQVPSPMFTEDTWSSVNDPSIPLAVDVTGIWDATKKLSKGLLFQNKEDLQIAVKRYGMMRNTYHVVVKSTTDFWKLRCKNGCKWKLKACKRIKHGLFEITKYEGPHTCVSATLTQDHAMLTTKLIEHEVRELVKADPSIKISIMRASIRQKFDDFLPSYNKTWNAKQKAIANIFGD
ncbi:uncharacterized protein LOC114323800 [Camellia sinensis]|uniref:uncharacterized protein LOC114323800 n=1 Tax=Camellia sinensis TaxID=4442 RepID=UPI001035F08A|nr:uncharacterized protein LOC114323800 [Camellia sinensis]